MTGLLGDQEARTPCVGSNPRKRVDAFVADKVVEGILYVLRAGCRWKDLPNELGSPVTAWRRLKRWEEDGTWERLWLTLLSKLDEAQKLDWSKAFLDGSFIPAKKGERRSG